jgi:aldehyde:ferredoxin oxidoreductase
MSYLTAGKILRIDLTDKTITTQSTAPYEKQFIGGEGIGAKILYDEVAPGIDALAPDNVLIFSAAAMAGTFFPGSGRTYVLAKSPMTGYAGICHMSGHWSPELKYAGYDVVVVKGKSEKPVYIAIDNDRVEIRDAADIWGRGTVDAQAAIRREVDDLETQIVCIGPAGEKLIRYAIIAHDIHNTAGRTGLGAVMGSKNLKAIAVRGTKGVKLADPEKFFELVKEAHDLLRDHPVRNMMAAVGVTEADDAFAVGEVMGTKNFQRPIGFDNIQGHEKEFAEGYTVKHLSCFACPVACRQNIGVPGLRSGGSKCAQYVPLFLSDCTDPILNFEAAILCQEAGVDVVQIDNILGWLMELSDRGIITEKDTDGIAMKWGDGRAAIQMIKKIIAREGIGDVLAENYETAARKFGKGAEDYFVHVKGVGVEVLDLRGPKGSALAGAVSTRGDHTNSYPPLESTLLGFPEGYEGEDREQVQQYVDELAMEIAGTLKAGIVTEYEGKAASVKYYEDMAIVGDMLGICRWQTSWFGMPIKPEMLAAPLYSAGKGLETTFEDILQVAHRVHALERAFSVREGRTRDDDTLPKRFLQEPVAIGRFKGEKIEPAKFEDMKTEYYSLRGWDPSTGVPTQATLEKLGLNDAAKDMRSIKSLTKEIAKEVMSEEVKVKTKGKNAE